MMNPISTPMPLPKAYSELSPEIVLYKLIAVKYSEYDMVGILASSMGIFDLYAFTSYT